MNVTRESILRDYEVNERGIIYSPGKFEGEMIYVPYYWDALLNGMADSDEDGVARFRVTEEDRTEFPELADVSAVALTEGSNGFVYLSHISTRS